MGVVRRCGETGPPGAGPRRLAQGRVAKLVEEAEDAGEAAEPSAEAPVDAPPDTPEEPGDAPEDGPEDA